MDVCPTTHSMCHCAGLTGGRPHPVRIAWCGWHGQAQQCDLVQHHRNNSTLGASPLIAPTPTPALRPAREGAGTRRRARLGLGRKRRRLDAEITASAPTPRSHDGGGAAGLHRELEQPLKSHGGRGTAYACGSARSSTLASGAEGINGGWHTFRTNNFSRSIVARTHALHATDGDAVRPAHISLGCEPADVRPLVLIMVVEVAGELP